MELRDLIEETIRESINYPILFLPFFLISLLNNVFISNRVISALGANWSLIISLLFVVILVPIGNGITIVMDRGIVSGKGPNPPRALEITSSRSFLLIGINFVAWMAAITGIFLLIVPGIYLYVKFIFVTQEVLLGNADDFETGLRSSWARTTGHWSRLFALLLVLEVPLLLLSLLAGQLPIGLAQTFQVILSTVAQTWIILAFTHIYVRISRGA
ncbi:hypothetical protein KGY64_06890 [Candidatus Bipolaricaulota bacterium]|nr:hypothetical protein [Candidatus Bipolaricaulota bacterium]